MQTKTILRYAETHIEMIDCQRLKGNPFQAKSLAENTLIFIQNELNQENKLKARCLTLLGLSYLNLGRNDEALDYLKQAESLFVEEVTIVKADCFDALGQVYTNNENRGISCPIS